ncbi:uncharacterized protein F5891DRAFT_1186832 [Suillus fuscotomentosus]|uniref:Uncharacterized protein n=1 Tax=Suillus fuscotomentosus TaxID=1912939 RepID=A0AAD4HLN3_9AGAM|nr:uncharacterized protein F5891DRAFT_1186832 [Suillus fuscotomentosus]KAG1902250.1 hypothetical protein F5891DRAFT_1186832 [Suillus fuscotomentosus]
MSGYELVSQFTEDAFAKDDRVCERPACSSKILKGDPCFYVATVDPGTPGRYVCGPCHRRYQGKLATTVRPCCELPDPHIIWQSVNAAQRKSTINPPPVVAMAHIARPMPGPSVNIPSTWQHSQHPFQA